MTIEQRIRKLAKSKVNVSITKKRRSKGGFLVAFPSSGGNNYAIGVIMETKKVPTHKQACVELLTAMRLYHQVEFSIKPVAKLVSRRGGGPC